MNAFEKLIQLTSDRYKTLEEAEDACLAITKSMSVPFAYVDVEGFRVISFHVPNSEDVCKTSYDLPHNMKMVKSMGDHSLTISQRMEKIEAAPIDRSYFLHS